VEKKVSTTRILVVDDEESVRDLLRDALIETGWAVDTAGTGAEALQQIRDNLYDAAVLDFALPDTNGVMLHRKIREMDPELAQRTLFISGVAQSDQRLDYFGADGIGFVSKPFDVWEVVSRLQKIVSQ
jgi:two-component system OmpR family response regulator